jgi:nucleotide-binding universal stress UspA family protein
MQPIRKILVPVDFSDHSARALDHAIGLAKVFGAEIDLLHSYEVTPIVTLYGVGYPATLDADLRGAATQRLSTWREKALGEGLTVRQHVVSSPASEAIVDLAKEMGVDLIVMGTRGLRGLKHVMLGSVAERTLRRAPCPVLTVRDPAAD